MTHYPKSRLPGPAVKMFDLEYERELRAKALQASKEVTVRVSYDAETVKMCGG